MDEKKFLIPTVSSLPTMSCDTNGIQTSTLFSSRLKASFAQPNCFDFLDFLDNNLVEENIVVADKEQLMRIAALVKGVEFE
jgi:hypothetical protein